MSSENIELGVRVITRRGGSLQVTLPTDVIKLMKLVKGDRIIFKYHKSMKRIVLGKVTKKELEALATLEFSMPEDLARKVLKRR